MEVENSFFEFRPSAEGSDIDKSLANTNYEVSHSDSAVDESMRSAEAIDDSMRSNDSFSVLRSVPASARKLIHKVVDESDEDENTSKPTIPKFSLGGTDSTDSSFIGRKKCKKAVVLSESGSDSEDVTYEDDLITSAVTRKSILGFEPKNIGDDFDYFDSDEPKSGLSSRCSSLSDLPAVDVTQHCESRYSNARLSKGNDPIEHIEGENSTKSKNSFRTKRSSNRRKSEREKDVECDLTMVDGDIKPNSDNECTEEISPRISNSSSPLLPNVNVTSYIDKVDSDFPTIKAERLSTEVAFEIVANNYEKDVQFVPDEQSEVVILSSDDEEMEVKPLRESSQKPDIRKFLAPKSYPNSNVVYVPRHVKINETNKLEGLKDELHKIKYLMENIDMSDLPDKGRSLQKRLDTVQKNYREQAERVADMIIEPDKPTVEQIEGDGFGKKKDLPSTKGGKNATQLDTPTWDELQAGSNQVQPKMSGKQAMSTHFAERSMILDRLRDLHESLDSRPAESELAAPPAAVTATLMPHQLHALAWLRWRETQRPRAGILADDMGLGKTLTMISLVVSDKESRLDRDDDDEDEERNGWNNKENSKLINGGTLVICPATLLQQWAAEVERHVTGAFLTVCRHHGPARATQPYKLTSYDIVITTYNIVSRDLDKKGVLMRIRWSRVILDEAHIVRNHKALMSRAVSALESPRRWCLTGTPVQNKELDIFALLKFMRCTPFDDIAMWKKWIDNKSAGGQERLATVMRTLLLRRTKQQLQEKGSLTCLPSREKTDIQIKLNAEEAKIYQKVLLLSRTLFAQYLQQRGDRRNSTGDGFLPPAETVKVYDKMHKRLVALHGTHQVKSHEILVLLLRLRQVCCHAGLIAAMLDHDAQDSEEESSRPNLDLLSELDRLTIEEDANESMNKTSSEIESQQINATAKEALRSVMSPNNPVFRFENVSSKIQAALKCLKDNVLRTPNEKAVVVSQWTSVLALVERSLREENIVCSTLSGAVPVKDRAAVVDDINNHKSNTRVLLLSLCAGGVGLNLCGANHLLLMDPHWNPQLEEQAQDRIYRVGQARPVHIYKFITLDTVEEKIKRLQDNKLMLASNVLTGARHNNSKLTIDDLKMLFNMN